MSWQQLKETAVNSLNDSVLHVDVGAEGLVIVHDLGSFNQETVALEKNEDQLQHLWRIWETQSLHCFLGFHRQP